MAKKQITSASSVQERAQAAQELRQAQQELSDWAAAQPPRYIDGVEFTGYTYGEYANQARYISSKYDYVDFGTQPQASDVNQPTVNLGGDRFFVQGLGNDPAAVQEPETEVTSTDPALTQPIAEDVPESKQQTPGEIKNPNSPTTRQPQQFQPAQRVEQNSNVNPARLPDELIPLPNTTNNQQATNPTNLNSDDRGGLSGTGINNRNTSQGAGNSTGGISSSNLNLDSGRPDLPPGQFDTNNTSSITSNNAAVNIDQQNLTEAETGSGIGSAADQSRPNILHDFANWTYNIALYMLRPGELPTVAPGAQAPGTLLMRSGGRGGGGANAATGGFGPGGAGGQTAQQQFFGLDYYFKSLRFASIFGQNPRTTKSSNNFNIEFEIVEPYGVAFLGELIGLSQQLGIPDHLDTPYLLEITFRGYDDEGRRAPGLENIRKVIPIKIIGIQFSITSAATVYTISAVPYHHSVMVDYEKTRIGTGSAKLVGRTFGELLEQFQNKLNADMQKNHQEKGYSGQADTIAFQIMEDDMRDAVVGFDQNGGQRVVEIVRQKMEDGGDPSAETIQIQDGSLLKDALQKILDSTDFGARFNTRNQPNSEGDNRPIRLLKIVPVITQLGSYITEQKRFSRTLVFKLFTEKKHGFDFINVANAQPRRYIKDYKWIFTGENKDIVNFSADYNTQYFFLRTNFQEEKSQVLGVQGTPEVRNEQAQARTERNAFSPVELTKSQPRSDKVAQSYRSGAHLIASDVVDQMLNNPKGDMLNVDLEIIGDPDWIPQDFSVFSSQVQMGDTSTGYINNAIGIDEESVHALLTFKTPRDYRDDNGLMNLESSQLFVQGLYTVIQCENIFENGKFTTILKMVRDQNQEPNEASNTGALQAAAGFFGQNASRDTLAQLAQEGEFANPNPVASSPQVSVGTAGDTAAETADQ